MHGDGSSKTGDSLENLSTILQEVERESVQLEVNLKAEISNLDHLKENVKFLEEQILEAEEYLKKRRILLLHVLGMESLPSFNVQEARDLLNRINHLDQIISRKVNLVGAEIRRYILNDAAQILTENVQNQGQITKIDDVARKLLAAVLVISAEVAAHNDSLKRMYQIVKVRENQSKAKGNLKLGF